MNVFHWELAWRACGGCVLHSLFCACVAAGACGVGGVVCRRAVCDVLLLLGWHCLHDVWCSWLYIACRVRTRARAAPACDLCLCVAGAQAAGVSAGVLVWRAALAQCFCPNPPCLQAHPHCHQCAIAPWHAARPLALSARSASWSRRAAASQPAGSSQLQAWPAHGAVQYCP